MILVWIGEGRRCDPMRYLSVLPTYLLSSFYAALPMEIPHKQPWVESSPTVSLTCRRNYGALFDQLEANKDLLSADAFRLSLLGRGDMEVPPGLRNTSIDILQDLPYSTYYRCNICFTQIWTWKQTDWYISEHCVIHGWAKTNPFVLLPIQIVSVVRLYLGQVGDLVVLADWSSFSGSIDSRLSPHTNRLTGTWLSCAGQ